MYNMSDSQKSIFYMEKVYPGTGICNIGGLLRFDFCYDEDILKLCCENMIKSNSNFWIKVDESGKIYFDKPQHVDMPEYDFSGYDEDAIYNILSGWMEEPLYKTDGYLYDIRIVHGDYAGIFVKVHHLTGDGYSVALFTKKITQMYDMMLSGGYDVEDDTGYMDKIIKENISVEEEPDKTDRKESFLFGKRAHTPYAGLHCRELNVDAGVLKQFLRSRHTGIEILVYASLMRYYGGIYDNETIRFGRNLVNRTGDEYRTLGMYVRTVPFVYRESDYENAVSVDEYLSQIRKQMKMNASDKESTGNEQFDIIISYRPGKLMEALKNGECIEIHNGCSEVPLKLFIKENKGKICIEYVYQKEIFADEYIKRLADRIDYIIGQIVCGMASDVNDIVIYDKIDADIIRRYNDTKKVGSTADLLGWFEENVSKYADKTALIYENESYTYKEVYDLVCRIKGWIDKNASDGGERIIAVSLARSKWNPVVLYAIWKAGYAYLPASIHNSRKRNYSIYEKCAAVIDEDVISDIMHGESLICETDDATAYKNDKAYYMFTSGTTGEPKAVAISHTAFAIRISWMAETFSDGTDIILHKTNSAFDVSMWELALPFAYGKTLCVAKEGYEKDPEKLVEIINRKNVTMIHFVPSMFQAFIKCICNAGCTLSSLRYIILSGERLDAALVKKAAGLIGDAAIYNLYGPTECTIDVSYYECSGDEEVIPIGRPVWNTGLYVCNKNGELLPVGEKGELLVKGSLLGEYSDIFSENISGGFRYVSGERCYFTGDIASLSDDGYMYFYGRKDSQTKIRGMRINISELEEVLNNAFEGCVHVLVCESDRLIDFYEGEIAVSDIEKLIDEKFQYYYRPSAIIRVDKLPVKENGKADREMLLDKYYNPKDAYETGRSVSQDVWELERIKTVLIKCAEKYVKGGITGPDNPVQKGMDSLSGINYIIDMEQYGMKITYNMLIKARSINELAEYIYNYSADNQKEEIVYLNDHKADELILAVPFAGGTPLSFIGLCDAIDKKKYDFAVVNTEFFDSKSIHDLSEAVCISLAKRKYGRIHIIGACVGSSMAIEICKKLSENAANLILCESLPYAGMNIFGRTYSVWDVFPLAVVERILQFIRRKPLKMDEKMLARFRRDVKKSAEWIRSAEPVRIDCPVSLIYGTQDILTKGYVRKHVKWMKYIQPQSGIEMHRIENAGHFLIEDYAGDVADIFHFN